MLEFDSFNQEKHNSIKVIGVGGGGGNAVNHMFRQGIEDVDFYICNTDRQALSLSPIMNKIQIGQRGTGAGSNPMKGKECAIESMDKIKEIFTDECDMLFITAGMGGGTGTGAAPVIANMAKDAGILTVAIVTLPFAFEGSKRLKQAAEGLEELKKACDGLLVINNDKLRELYGNVDFLNAFKYADNILCTAASGIARFVTSEGVINGDFEDVKSVIKDAGRVIMGTGEASGENRAIEAVQSALNSPLLDDNDITGAKDMLLYIVSGTADMLKMDEITQITDYICDATGCDTNIIQSLAVDENLDDRLSITCIVAGLDIVNAFPIEKEKREVTIVTPIVNEVISEKMDTVTNYELEIDADKIDNITHHPQSSNVTSKKTDNENYELKVETNCDSEKIPILDEIDLSISAVGIGLSSDDVVFEVRNMNEEVTSQKPILKTQTTENQEVLSSTPKVSFESFPTSQQAKQTEFIVDNRATHTIEIQRPIINQNIPSIGDINNRTLVAEKLVFIDPRERNNGSQQSSSTQGNNRITVQQVQPTIKTAIPGNTQSTKEDFRKQLEKMSSINFGHDFTKPAFERRSVTLVDVEPSDSQPKTTFVVDSNNTIKENSFLHKSID